MDCIAVGDQLPVGIGVLHFFADKLDWEFILDAARWTYDEARHTQMGYARLTGWGFEPEDLPLGTYIFDAARGEGQFPMAQPGQIMTNATVQQVMTNATVQQVNGSTGTIKLSFKGAGAPGTANCTGRAAEAPGGAGTGCTGQTEFEVPANVPIVQQQPGNVSMLKAGAKATMNVSMGADGAATASRVTVSE